MNTAETFRYRILGFTAKNLRLLFGQLYHIWKGDITASMYVTIGTLNEYLEVRRRRICTTRNTAETFRYRILGFTAKNLGLIFGQLYHIFAVHSYMCVAHTLHGNNACGKATRSSLSTRDRVATTRFSGGSFGESYK
jgi:hypothetical protein